MKYLKLLKSYFLSNFSKVQLAIIVALLVFAFLISDSNIFTRIGYDAEIMSLNSQIDFYKKQARKDSTRLEELNSNRNDIEKFARENFMMKNEDEDIFLVE